MKNIENQNRPKKRNITPSNSSKNGKNREIKSVRDRYRRVAILVGINDYKNGVPHLDTPIKDASSIAETLIDFDYEILKTDDQEYSFEKNVYLDLNRKQQNWKASFIR